MAVESSWDERFSKASANDVQRILALMGGPISILEDYIVPGLRSSMYAATRGGGMMRLFEMQRHQEMEIVPHDHRYDFQCMVLEGAVKHRVYEMGPTTYPGYVATHAAVPYDPQTKDVDVLDYESLVLNTLNETVHKQGEWYGLTSNQFHSVVFDKGSKVLFLEGPPVKSVSRCLLPMQDGRILNTYFWAPWMMRSVNPTEYKQPCAS